MSSRIRALRKGQTEARGPRFEDLPLDIQQHILWMQEMGGENQDYLQGPSMASVLLRQAKGDYLKSQMQQANELGTGSQVSPMIASILQLDRQ